MKIKFEKIILYWATAAAMFFAVSGLFAIEKSLALILFLPVALYLFVELTNDLKSRILKKENQTEINIGKKGLVFFALVYLTLIALAIMNITSAPPESAIIVGK